ncbi:MAG: squalene/phytoene synthase family protein [Parvularculaceae bacterium]
MRILFGPRRDAMHAIYAFYREVDDIADEEDPSRKNASVCAAWRGDSIQLFQGARRKRRRGVALLEPVRAFDLPREEFILMIEGMEMDAEGPIVAPTTLSGCSLIRAAPALSALLSMPVSPARRAPKRRTGFRLL